MNARKVTQVADSLHYSIPITAMEKEVISTQIFNRLHNILQNSTVFFTFPSCRTSRFAHSLGAMHLAGSIIQNGVVNAQAATRRAFLGAVLQEARRIAGSEAFRSQLEATTATKGLITRDFESPTWDIADPLYDTALPGTITDGPERFAFLLAYQALRLVAVLHDLGHPPFSHVAEFAIGDLHGELRAVQIAGDDLTPRQQQFFAIVQEYLTRAEKGRAEIHEPLGVYLAQCVLQEVTQRRLANPRAQLCRLMVRSFALAILANREPFFTGLHSLVDCDAIQPLALDCDRLDYVPRDLAAAGASKDPFPFDRLLSSFELMPWALAADAQQQHLVTTYVFLPRVQALSSIEDFLSHRFRLYKFHVYHHRVAKTDGLLREAIKILGREYLEQKGPIEPAPENAALPNHISGLWLTLKKHYTTPIDIAYYIQWDDAWLLATLRHHYFALLDGDEKGADPTLLRVQLEEILSGRKSYYSLVKRVDSFMSVDEAFLSACPADFDWSPLSPERLVGSQRVVRSLLDAFSRVTDYHRAFVQSGDAKALRESRGFFFHQMLQYLEISSRFGANSADILFEALERFKGRFGLADVIAIPKPLKPKVTNKMPLVMEGSLIELKAVSRLATELDKEVLLFPPFFVYVYKPEWEEARLDETTLDAMRRDLGRLIWEVLHERAESPVERAT